MQPLARVFCAFLKIISDTRVQSFHRTIANILAVYLANDTRARSFWVSFFQTENQFYVLEVKPSETFCTKSGARSAVERVPLAGGMRYFTFRGLH